MSPYLEKKHAEVRLCAQLSDSSCCMHAIISITGTVLNSDKANATFNINAEQYISFSKLDSIYHFSVLSIHAMVNKAKYRNKKPTPSKNTNLIIVSILLYIELNEDTKQLSLFHIVASNIGFLRRSTIPAWTKCI
jgi:hypothetical protein